MLHLSHLVAAGALFAGFSMAAEPASSESWPERTVRIITPFNPGISVDVAARTLAETLSKQWKQPVVVENRPGADTMIGTQAFLEMRDDHALLFTTHSTFTVIPLLRAKVPYGLADVKPISLAVEDFLTVAVTPKLEVGSLSQFAALARENPDKLNSYAVPGSPYLAYLAFQKQAGFHVRRLQQSRQCDFRPVRRSHPRRGDTAGFGPGRRPGGQGQAPRSHQRDARAGRAERPDSR